LAILTSKKKLFSSANDCKLRYSDRGAVIDEIPFLWLPRQPIASIHPHISRKTQQIKKPDQQKLDGLKPRRRTGSR